jgi:hypothetical protein
VQVLDALGRGDDPALVERGLILSRWAKKPSLGSAEKTFVVRMNNASNMIAKW